MQKQKQPESDFGGPAKPKTKKTEPVKAPDITETIKAVEEAQTKDPYDEIFERCGC